MLPSLFPTLDVAGVSLQPSQNLKGWISVVIIDRLFKRRPNLAGLYFCILSAFVVLRKLKGAL